MCAEMEETTEQLADICQLTQTLHAQLTSAAEAADKLTDICNSASTLHTAIDNTMTLVQPPPLSTQQRTGPVSRTRSRAASAKVMNEHLL